MSAPARILLIDDNASDRALALLVLRQHFPAAELEEAADAVAFAEQLARGGFQAVVAEPGVGWADGRRLLESVRRACPECVLVVLTGLAPEDAALRPLWPALDAYVYKGSAGFLELPAVVREALATGRGRGAPQAAWLRMLDDLPVGLFSLDGQGGIVDANRSLARMLGQGGIGALLGRPLEEFFPDAGVRARWRSALAGEAPPRDLEARMQRADGRTLWVRVNLAAAPRAGEAAARLEGIIEDLSEFKQAEDELRRRAEALERSYEELEQLSYAVSHDLQEPLQLISRYARLLFERYGSRFDADAGRFLGHVVESAERMQALIDAVLEYSHIGTPGAALPAVDFNAVLDEALGNLRALIDEAQAEIQREPLPTLPADERQMVQLFQNLIGNALKFRGPEPPRIRVAAKQEVEHWQFAVRDNGVGIDPAQAGRIFGMFQRLHTQNEYPGTGIGLAMCKKILERHGGRIWVRSQPGKGSTFFFTIAGSDGEGAAAPPEGGGGRAE